jgi:hypothetical protein
VDESITIERVRDALVVGRLDRDGAAVLLAANLRPRRGATYVVIGESVLDAVHELDPWLLDDIDEATTGALTLVGPGLAAPGPDTSPARRIADILGVEVTAPADDPVPLPDGSLFVPGPNPGWVTFRPYGATIEVGARLPAPWWQAGLPAANGQLVHVPAGLWLRQPGAPDRPDDPLHGVPADLDRMYLVVGAPGEPLPSRDTAVELLRALPDEGRDRAVLVSYGGSAARIAQQLADDLGAPVRAAHGVPTADGGLSYVDRTGTARWQPFALESVYQPGAVPMLDRWTTPPRLPMIEPGAYRLAPGWRVDVVPRGLAAHPDGTPLDQTMLAADTGPTADIVVATDGHLPDEVRVALDRLMGDLPAPTRNNLRVLPAAAPAAAALSAIEAVHAVVPQPSTVESQRPAAGAPTGRLVITAGGRILPLATTSAADNAGTETLSTATPAPVSSEVARPRGGRTVVDREHRAVTPRPPAPAEPGQVVGMPRAEPEVDSVLSLLPGRAGPRSVPPVAPRPAVTITSPSADAQPAAEPSQKPRQEPARNAAPEPSQATPVAEVPEGARSTTTQRQSMRERLGARYDLAARVVTTLLSERPGLRSGGADRAAQLAELAVVRAFIDNPDGPYDTDFHIVLADGLRRLPTARAVVVRGIPDDTDVRPDSTLRLPTPVIAAPASATPAGPAEALIWTTTGRRIDDLQDKATGEVVLPGHTRLRVLAVERSPVHRVLLAEEGAAADAAVARLRAVADKRNGTTGPAVARWFGQLPTS